MSASIAKTIRAWKDPLFRESLSEAELAEIPDSPAGSIELTDEEQEMASGGGGPYWARGCNSVTPSTPDVPDVPDTPSTSNLPFGRKVKNHPSYTPSVTNNVVKPRQQRNNWRSSPRRRFR